MPTFYEPTERTEHFLDADGVVTYSQDTDEVKSYSIDWTDALGSSETVSTSTWTSGGVTLSGAALVTPVASVTVTGTDGWAKDTVVTSASRTLVRLLRFVGVPDGDGPTSDY